MKIISNVDRNLVDNMQYTNLLTEWHQKCDTELWF